MTTPLAMIVGATGGLGRVIAQAFVTAGWAVACCGRSAARLTALPVYAPAGQRVSFHCCEDVRAERWHEQVAMVLDAHEESLLQTVVVAHGAAPCLKPFAALTREEWDTIQSTDVTGAFLVAQAVESYLKASQGSLTLISSMHAVQTYPYRTPYAVAKAAVCAMARALAVEWGVHGVRVNAIAPGQVATPRSTEIAARLSQEAGYDVEAAWKARSPMAKLVTPEDVARTALWLAETPSVTGQTIVVDCGVTVSAWYAPFGQEAR